MINKKLKIYIEQNILPLYQNFDKAHQLAHVQSVMEESLRLAKIYNVDENMVYTAAAFHDVGLQKDRETHHLESARILRNDVTLKQWFGDAQIEAMAMAAEDHRASNKYEPRSILGKIIAEADRNIEPFDILRRTVQFGLANYPQLNKTQHYQRFVKHLQEKYAEGGYLKLWIKESKNAIGLAHLRKIIADKKMLKQEFENIFLQETDVNLRNRLQ